MEHLVRVPNTLGLGRGISSPPRTAQWDLAKHLSVLLTLLLWVCQALKPLHGASPLHKSGGRGDWRGRVRKTFQKFRGSAKTDKVCEKEYEQTRNTIKHHMSGRKVIKAYLLNSGRIQQFFTKLSVPVADKGQSFEDNLEAQLAPWYSQWFQPHEQTPFHYLADKIFTILSSFYRNALKYYTQCLWSETWEAT